MFEKNVLEGLKLLATGDSGYPESVTAIGEWKSAIPPEP
jgi:hypothetical protein